MMMVAALIAAAGGCATGSAGAAQTAPQGSVATVWNREPLADLMPDGSWRFRSGHTCEEALKAVAAGAMAQHPPAPAGAPPSGQVEGKTPTGGSPTAAPSTGPTEK